MLRFDLPDKMVFDISAYFLIKNVQIAIDVSAYFFLKYMQIAGYRNALDEIHTSYAQERQNM